MLKHFAFFAETRIIFGLVSAEQMHDESAQPLNGEAHSLQPGFEGAVRKDGGCDD